MKGAAPVRRTIKYLEAGRIQLKDKIRVVSINYSTHGEHHRGARDFVFWTVPQLQYKNPEVQIVTFKNMTPTPFIQCYYGEKLLKKMVIDWIFTSNFFLSNIAEDGKKLLVDIDSRSNDDIIHHLIDVIGKPKEVLEAEAKAAEKKDNPANFGVGCDRSCMCEIPLQVPCPGVVKMPNYMRGKYRFAAD